MATQFLDAAAGPMPDDKTLQAFCKSQVGRSAYKRWNGGGDLVMVAAEAAKWLAGYEAPAAPKRKK
jgi:hypothetical protein